MVQRLTQEHNTLTIELVTLLLPVERLINWSTSYGLLFTDNHRLYFKNWTNITMMKQYEVRQRSEPKHLQIYVHRRCNHLDGFRDKSIPLGNVSYLN